MPQDIDRPAPENIRDLLLQHKYHAAIRRLARGITHSYNNIFTGLSGQMAILWQEAESPASGPDGRRKELIDNLLRRGIEQTAILYEFTRDTDTNISSHSPLLAATKALELLNTISRVHRFVLKSGIRQEKIFCNLRELVLILFYLGENCVDATPEGGGINLTIDRQASCTQQAEVIFSFHDHGHGFAADILSAPFAPLVTTRPAPHQGLGLYAANCLAQKNLGRLAIAQGEGRTAVSAVFPLAREGAAGEKAFGNEAGTLQGIGKQCFLVVEDDESLRACLLNWLQRRGHMVFCVETCAEALEEYGQLHDIITIVLMDVGLRDTSGYACLREMLKINPRVRVIYMSGYREAAPAEFAGRHPFLHKPFTFSQLEQAIRDTHV